MVSDKLTAWAHCHPETMHLLDTLNRREVRWGLFSGGHIQFLPDARPIDDHDILTDEAGFHAISSLPEVSVQAKDMRIACGDGETIQYSTYDASVILDGKTVQVMLPAEMRCSNGSAYRLSMTELAARRRLASLVGGTVLYCTNPLDTALAKAGLQRTAPKQDASDVRALAGYYDLAADRDYARERASQFGADQRVHTFLARHAGLVLPEPAAAAV